MLSFLLSFGWVTSLLRCWYIIRKFRVCIQMHGMDLYSPAKCLWMYVKPWLPSSHYCLLESIWNRYEIVVSCPFIQEHHRHHLVFRKFGMLVSIIAEDSMQTNNLDGIQILLKFLFLIKSWNETSGIFAWHIKTYVNHIRLAIQV